MRLLKEQIDRWAIGAAARSLPRVERVPSRSLEIERTLADPGWFNPPEVTPELRLANDHSFEFSSTVVSPFVSNNTVHGRIFPADPAWRKSPAVVMVHGWNAEMHYLSILPRLARALNKRGLTCAVFELPFHLHRRPPRAGGGANFISEDIPRMLEAVRQSVWDMNGLVHWLKAQGSPSVALWGFSLGGWLAGLHLCSSNAQDAVVLTTPVSNMERAVAELAFCHPIRAALKTADPLDLSGLNLTSHAPKVDPQQIQLMQAKYDLFVPHESYAELARAWSLPGWECVPQSHITVLVSGKAMRQSISWLDSHLRRANEAQTTARTVQQ